MYASHFGYLQSKDGICCMHACAIFSNQKSHIDLFYGRALGSGPSFQLYSAFPINCTACTKNQILVNLQKNWMPLLLEIADRNRKVCILPEKSARTELSEKHLSPLHFKRLLSLENITFFLVYPTMLSNYGQKNTSGHFLVK